MNKVERATLLDKIAWYMDQAYQIPGTKIRVGWDPILGLFPGVGDTVTTLIQAFFVISAISESPSLPKPLILRMMVNVLLDAAIGSIPILGKVFDVFYKANTRNMQLLLENRRNPQAAGKRHTGFLIVVIFVMLALVAGTIWMSIAIFKWLYTYLF